MIFDKYDSYKDSGLDWLGDIPSEWGVKRLKEITKLLIDGIHFTPTYTDNGINFLAVNDITRNNFDILKSKYISVDAHNQLKQRCYPKKGDLLLSKNGTIGIPFIINFDTEISIYVSLCLMKLNKQVKNTFLYYMFLSSTMFEQYKIHAKTNSVTNLHLDKLNNFFTSLPPLKTQTKIASYLDTQTQKIDKEIKLLEQKSLKYKELKQTLINETVLRGVENGVKFETKRLKDSLTILSSGINNFKNTKKYLSTKSISENKIVKIEDIITIDKRPSRANMQPLINTIWFAKMRFTNKCFGFYDKDTANKYILSTGFCGLKINNQYLKFVNYYIMSKYFLQEKDMYSYGTTQESISDNNIGRLIYNEPPLKEQIKIVSYLDEKVLIIDNITKTIKTKIALLKEFRKTLINDTVTGKIKVA